MAEKTEVKSDALPDLDDLLQCPVCYEIPSGQIFQCNEGHHVCGRCKIRLDVCPVCRALFFGTRNYAMEELIANVKKLRAFKLGGKVTTGSSSSESNTPAIEENPAEVDTNGNDADDEENNLNFASRTAFRPPQPCAGLFRCMCCKNGIVERLPSSRLLNHLRFFHAPELIEGQSENGEYVQAWQFSTVPGRLVTAVRVTDMGIFFFLIEICNDSVCAWLTMATAPWVASEFCYTITISGNDREAIFSDSVWSVRSCEGTLKKRGHCLVVNGLDARALVAPAAISGKLVVRRARDDVAHQTQPRAVLRVASRGAREPSRAQGGDLEPFLEELQNDVARLSRAFATLGREASALVRSEAEMRNRLLGPRVDITQSPDRPVPRTNETVSADRSGARTNQTASTDRPGPRTNQTASTDRPGPRTNQAASTDRQGPRANQAASTDRPAPRANQAASTDRPAPRANQAASTDRPAPRANQAASTDRPAPRANQAASTDRPAPRANQAASTDRPAPRANQAASTDRPAPRANQAATTDRPAPRANQAASTDRPAPAPVTLPTSAQNNQSDDAQSDAAMSRSARRRMRLRLRAALEESQLPPAQSPSAAVTAVAPRQNGPAPVEPHFIGYAVVLDAPPVVPPVAPAAPAPSSGPSNGHPRNGTHSRGNKKKRRQRR